MSKWLRSKLARLLHPSNMEYRFVALAVLKLLIFKVAKLSQQKNIIANPRSVTLAVSKLLRSKATRLRQSSNMRYIFVTLDVSK